MRKDTFLQRIKNGRANNLVYSTHEKEGLISAWMYQDKIILTWEECRPGDQYNESSFTKDERHVFNNTEDLVQFLESRDINIEEFTP